MIAFLLALWDGWLLIGEGLGLENARAERFADVAWITLVLVTIVWAVSMAWVGAGL